MAFLEYRPTQTLFQYTSVEGFRGILRSKRLWLSDLRTANDPREIHLGFERMIRALAAGAGDEGRRVNGILMVSLVGQLTGYLERAQAFCSCFSLAADELPMWSAYGQSYGGLAVGFRPAAILSVPGRVQRVKYLEKSIEEEVFKEVASKIAAQVELYRAGQDLTSWIGAATDAIAAVLSLKHQIWSYEKEIRIVYVQRKERPNGSFANIPVSKGPGGVPLLWQAPLERLVGTRQVQYVAFPFGRFRDGRVDPSRAIKTVIVGPNCTLSVSAVEAELKAQGFVDFAVTKSDCHIRA